MQQHGYRQTSPFKNDKFERFNGIIFDQQGKKYFVKAVIGKNRYAYKSLFWESQVTRYLSIITKKPYISYNGYRLYIPSVAKTIAQDEIFCLITNYIEGKKLSSASFDTQADVLLATLELVDRLGDVRHMSTIRPYLKKYTRGALFFSLPIRFIKATVLSPFAFFGLIRAFWITLPLLFTNIHKYGLVHPDISVTNIIFHKNTIYLTDWEEAGWGIRAYNTSALLCIYWQNKTFRNMLLRRLNDNGQKQIAVPLLAYRILMLFNQHIEKGYKNRKRDIMILKSLEKTKLVKI